MSIVNDFIDIFDPDFTDTDSLKDTLTLQNNHTSEISIDFTPKADTIAIDAVSVNGWKNQLMRLKNLSNF